MKTLLLTTLCGLFLAFTQLHSQLQTQLSKPLEEEIFEVNDLVEDEDFHPPHPDSLSDFIEGMDIQLYNGGEAYVIKDAQAGKNIPLPDAIEFAKSFSEIYGSGINAVPKVFDTNIKPDVSKSAEGGPPLAKTADTSLCNQIIWSEPMLLFDNGASWLNLAVVGDTVHGVTGMNPQPIDMRLQYYCRSTDGGVTFDVRKNIREDSIRTTGGTGWTRIVAHRNMIFLFFDMGDTVIGGDLRVYSGFMRSTNGGETFTIPKKFVDYESYAMDVANSGDTIVVVIGDCRGTRPAPVPMYIYISTNFGETWKFRGYAGGRRVYDPRIALAGGWLHQTNRYFPPGRWTRSEVAYYRSKVMRKNWLKREVLSTNDGISSIQGDPVAEPNGFVGVIWNDGKYGSYFGHDGTPLFRRSLNYGKTFEPEVRLTDSPEASWGVMKLKSIATKLPVISAVWSVTWENEYETKAIRLSLDGGSSWCPIYYDPNGISGLSPSTAVGNGKVYWTMYDVYIGSYFVYGILPPNLKTETTQTFNEQNEENDQIIKISNYPNPFNPNTTISYNLTQSGYVTLKVYDVLGREAAVLIDNEYKEEGEYEKEFSAGGGLTSGVYYYRISLRNENGIQTTSGKMLLMK